MELTRAAAAPRTPPVIRRRLVLTPRDTAIIDTVLRLGAADADTLRQLHAPHVDPHTVRRRLRRLTHAGMLKQTRPTGPAVAVYLVGPAALDPDQERPWHPSDTQTQHTLQVGRTLVALLRPAMLPGITLRRWEGEAELRGWEPPGQPGQPRPDLVIHWTANTGDNSAAGQRTASAALAVEVDRGTEATAAWRRKLDRYRRTQRFPLILAVTTTDTRARHLARLAATIGTPLITLGQAALADLHPTAYDSRDHRTHTLGQGLIRTQTE